MRLVSRVGARIYRCPHVTGDFGRRRPGSAGTCGVPDHEGGRRQTGFIPASPGIPTATDGAPTGPVGIGFKLGGHHDRTAFRCPPAGGLRFTGRARAWPYCTVRDFRTQAVRFPCGCSARNNPPNSLSFSCIRQEVTVQTACPTCRKVTTWEENKHRPFCSEKCRMIDLGTWASEGYRIAGEEAGTPLSDPEWADSQAPDDNGRLD